MLIHFMYNSDLAATNAQICMLHQYEYTSPLQLQKFFRINPGSEQIVGERRHICPPIFHHRAFIVLIGSAAEMRKCATDADLSYYGHGCAAIR